MSKNRPARSPAVPQAALDALLADPAGNPIRRALWLDELDRRLRPHLPPLVAAHARLANVDRDRLVLVVDAPVWQARTRLATEDILKAARSVGLVASVVVVKVGAIPPLRSQPSPTVRPMSDAAREALRSALASLADAPAPVPRRRLFKPKGSEP